MKVKLLSVILFTVCHLGLQAQCSKIDSLIRALPYASVAKDRVNILNQLSENYQLIGNQSRSYYYARQAVLLANNTRYEEGQAAAYRNQGRVSYAVNPQNLDESIASFQKAIQINKKLQDKEGLAATYAAYGSFFREISYAERTFLDSAVIHYKEAYQIYYALNNKSLSSEVANNIAEVYFEKGEDDEAFEYSKLSLEGIDTQFSKARIVKKFLQKQSNQRARFNYLFMAAIALLSFLMILLFRGIIKTRKTNLLLERQKKDLQEKNDEISQQKKEIENQKQNIQETLNQLQARNKEIDRQYKQILLQQEEIEMRNDELKEKNEELKQTQEEIQSQRDNLAKQAKEMEVQAEELRKSNETITILSRIGQGITSTLNTNEIFDTFYGYVTQLMPADGFRVSEYNSVKGELQYKFNTESQMKKPLIRVSMDEENNPAVWCVKNKRPILVNTKKDLEHYNMDTYSINPRFNSMIYYPLFQDNEVIGAVGVYSRQNNAFDHHHIGMIKTLASYTTIALKNAATYELLNAAQEQLVESEKMAALGNLVAGVAHEINTPVGICVTAASRLDSKTKELKSLYKEGKMKRKNLEDFLEVNQEGNQIILSNLTRAADLVQGFKRVAVEQSSENKRVFNLKTYLEETVLALNPEFKNKPYKIELDAEEEIEINSYAGAFSQIITNLAMNSLIHGFRDKEAGTIGIKARKNGQFLELIYHDDGNGMTEEVKNKIFEPFFTTNRDGGGTGLGMNIVYNLTVQKLGGKLALESELGEGTRFTFEIPLNN